MSVYFAQVGRYIKVGYSENPERRVRNLFKSSTRYGAPKDIDSTTPRTLLAAVPGGTSREGLAHLALDDFRVLGEWFLDEPEVRGYIAACVTFDEVVPMCVSRPAGEYWWGDDPLLTNAQDEDFQLAHALSGWFTPAASP